MHFIPIFQGLTACLFTFWVGSVFAAPMVCQNLFQGHTVVLPSDLNVNQMVALKGYDTLDRRVSFSDTHGTHLMAREFPFLAELVPELLAEDSAAPIPPLPEGLRGLDALSFIFQGKMYALALVEPSKPESGVEQPQLRWWDHSEGTWLGSRVPIPTGRGLGGDYRLALYLPEGLSADLAMGPKHSPALALITDGRRVWGFPINDWVLPQ